jgi:hypothetical protein
MTDHDIVVAGASAPAAQLPEVQLSTTLKLSDEQRAKALAAKAAYISAGLMTAEWIRRMRDLRDSLTSNGSGQTGWGRICEDDFGCDSKSANRMINGYEALFSGQGGGDQVPPTNLKDLAPTHFLEIGNQPPSVRMNLAALIHEGKLRLNRRDINAKAKELKSQARTTTLKLQAPAAPAPTPTLPTPKRGEATSNRSTTKLSRSKYGDLPEREKELGYLLGSVSANTKLDADLVKLLRSASSTGKIARIKVLAAALHREFKGIGDRYQRSWDKDSGYPSYMTLWQHIWAEDGTFHLHAELEAVRKDISEANRYFSIANMRLFTEDLEITE